MKKFLTAFGLIFSLSASADIHRDILNDFVNQAPVYSSDFNFNNHGSSSNSNNGSGNGSGNGSSCGANCSGSGNNNGNGTGTTPPTQISEPNTFLLFMIGVFIGWFFIRSANQKKPSAFHVMIMACMSLILLYITVSPVRAQVTQPIDSGISQNGNNQAASTSWSWSDSYSNSESLSESASNSTANASNYGNNQNSVVNFQNRHQAPAVWMNSPNPTAVCQASAGGFLSMFIFGGAGLNGTYTLEQCEMREEARIAYSIGQHGMAKEILCMAKYAKETEVCKQLKKD